MNKPDISELDSLYERLRISREIGPFDTSFSPLEVWRLLCWVEDITKRDISDLTITDLGSGHGIVLATAQLLGAKTTYGIEKEMYLVKKSNEHLMCNGFVPSVFHGDYFALSTFWQAKIKETDFFILHSYNNWEDKNIRGEHNETVLADFFVKNARNKSYFVCSHGIERPEEYYSKLGLNALYDDFTATIVQKNKLFTANMKPS